MRYIYLLWPNPLIIVNFESFNNRGGMFKFPLTPMGVLAPGSAHARPSAQPPIVMSGNFSPLVSPESKSKSRKKDCFQTNVFISPHLYPIFKIKYAQMNTFSSRWWGSSHSMSLCMLIPVVNCIIIHGNGRGVMEGGIPKMKKVEFISFCYNL